MKKYAIIAAGGSGQRMGSTVPKQFLELKGKPILWYSIMAFTNAFEDISIIVVAPATNISEAEEICQEFPNIIFAEGGASRFLSVKNGLAAVNEPSIVFVHDAVRCLVTTELIHRCYHQALEKGSAIPAVAFNDSVRMVEEDISKAIDRDSLRIIQTPQVFKSEIILPAFDVQENETFTDEATVVEASGKPVHLIEGEQSNIKITRPIDIIIAEKIIEQR
jgi:2-C-methyl-D-erythritol 4-phosphate cytidylyltransferase